MNILYLGSLTSYVTQNDVNALEALNHNVAVLISHSLSQNPPTGTVDPKKTIHLFDPGKH